MKFFLRLARRTCIALLGMGVVWAACAKEIVIMDSTLTRANETEAQGLYLHLNAEFDLSRNIEDTLMRGIPLYFITEFQLERQRWYWMDKEIDHTTLVTRLSYSPLTRQFRLSRGGLSQSFDSLKDVLDSLKVIHRWRVSSRAELGDIDDYEAEVRIRLDNEQLPLPMLVGMGDDDWKLDSDWHVIELDHRVTLPEGR